MKFNSRTNNNNTKSKLVQQFSGQIHFSCETVTDGTSRHHGECSIIS